MMRYFVHRIGPGHALGCGCVIGVILALLPVLGLVAAVLAVQAGRAEILEALGPLGASVAPRLGVPWYAVALAGLLLLLASGVFYAIGAWLVAVGFNLVARLTGGLALDLTPDASSALVLPMVSTLQRGLVPHDPTAPLPRPLHNAALSGPFPPPGGSALLFAGAPVAAAQGEAAAPESPLSPPPDVPPQGDQPCLVSEADSALLWPLRTPATTVGSDPANDVVLTGDAGVALRHAEIRVEPSGYVIYDLESPDGIYVNDRRIQVRNLLKNGFRVRLGSTVLLFRDLR